MARFFIPKVPHGLVNFSVVNDEGVRLSVAADDSCGALNHHGRVSAQLINADGTDNGDEVLYLTPKAYLFALADLLGYTVSKKG